MLGTGALLYPYLVETAEDFNEIRNLISSTVTYFKQVADIDLINYQNWTSLSINASNDINYDGQGYTISNINVNVSATYYGIFGSFKVNDFSIYNINFENIEVNNLATSGNTMVISTTCYVKNIKIKDMNVETKNITAPFSSIQASTPNMVIDNVKITGNISSSSYAIGIGYSSSSSNLTITNCVFEGNISSSSSYAIGISYSSSSSKILNCKVQGKIEGNYVGGIARVTGTTITTTQIIENCICEADIYAKLRAGGIIVSSPIVTKVENCYALMNKIVRKSGTSLDFGRIADKTTYTKLNNNYALDTMEFYDTDDRI